jgi:predicted ATP-dependent serine protease
MIYCMSCGTKNSNWAQKCEKCGMSFGAKIQLSVWNERNKLETKNKPSKTEDYDPEFSSTKLDIEPVTQEEINRFRVTHANQSINLKDMMKDAMKKDKDKKQSKPPKTRKRKK